MRYFLWKLFHYGRYRYNLGYEDGFNDGWDTGRLSGIADTEQYYVGVTEKNHRKVINAEGSDDDLPVYEEVGDL